MPYMVNSLAVIVAGLIIWPTPSCAVRFEARFAFDDIDIAEELLRHARELRKALEQVKTKGGHRKTNKYDLSLGTRAIYTRNQFFATCGLSDSAVRELANDKLQLRAVGKLAKSGDFVASTDSRWLVKAVSSDEEAKLTELGQVNVSKTELYSDCYGFNRSLLLPIPLAFIGTNRKRYLVMQNETKRLANRIRLGWQVSQVFDVKPLPNLAGQLAELVSTLSIGWLGSFEPLSTWDGWDDISNALRRDCQLLKASEVVDFSLFIHVLQRTSATNNSFPDLSADDGCITEPSRAAIVCFAILDYLLPFGNTRKFESRFKGDKFLDYGGKLMHAFACIGDLNGEDCQAYHDYSTILSAGELRDKAALLASQTFRHNYACQVERPKLRYQHKMFVARNVVPLGIHDEPNTGFHGGVPSWSDEVVELLPQAMHSSSWSYDGTGYDANVSSWLQAVVSSNNGGHVVSSGYEQLLEDGLEHPEKGFQLHKEELAACKEGIKSFATSSWTGVKYKHKDLGNIIWSPQSKSIFVVRGKNKLYSNRKFAIEMRQKHCFMLVHFFHCQALDGKRTIFDYRTSFGSLEVLQVMPYASSGDDFKVFREWKTS